MEVSKDELIKGINKNKALGVGMSGGQGVGFLTTLFNRLMQGESMPED